ncbi:Poly(ADP-ribose) polymerase pme-5 [Mizuhopecten yessoensis]|uniref:Poly [ADP-ribose] polymerase n=1 Tax=Mizuhopecten yessoensis TaxID=6573 RepID=A0A210QAE0_MIZYE|nr:Poly(ADP-ribose) polymerase pme-5 [Mizuhopecten yessoensis]
MDKSEGNVQEVTDSPNPGTSGNMSASKKKKVYNMEPRTPLKRQRVPVNRFQSPATEELPASAPKTPKGNKEEAVVLQYKKGVFLAVRGDEGSFYMCRTQQNVYKTTKHFKIQWLDLNEPPSIYKFDFLDATEIECVLTNVKMERIARETYRLPHSEKTRIENILLRALKKEKGEPIEEDDMLVEETVGEEDFAEDDSEEEDWEDDEPSAKKPKYSKSDKPKATPKSRKSITVALKDSGSKKSNTKSKGKKTEKEKVKKQKKEKKPEKEKKRGPDRKLKPNPKVRIVEKDPLFQTKDHVPFISKNAHAKLVFRAIFQNDIALLKQLLEDGQHINSVGAAKSLADSWTSLHYALKNNNVEAVSLLVKDILADSDEDNVRRKLPQPRQLISTISTGTYNPRYLGIRSVRTLTVGRGGKEGNQAFTKEKDEDSLTCDLISDALQMGVNKETLDVMIASSGENYIDQYNDEKLNNIVFAVLRGHRGLAGQLMEDALNRGGFGFNFLHKDVLVFNNEDLKQFQSASVRKKPLNNASMTPLHCACINPNIKYLEKLLSVEPDINLEDKGGRRPIHYAASCESTAPLELLIKKGANPNEVTRRRFTPLHYACYAERPKNIDLLLKTAVAKNAAEGDGGDPMMAKWGIGGINRPNWETVCPIHIAVQSGNAEVVKALLKHGVDVNKPLSASKEKVSPLMIAAGKGNLDIARLLIQAGAIVEQLDKFKRTALTHAVMNGSVTVTSYLLYLGADPNRVDSSNNSLVHYAAAYGWYFVLKMLVNEGGADPKKANDWKLTPVGIAFMKAHMGLVDFLLKMPGVDINFKNDSGMTLISLACGSELNSGLYDQIVYLMDKGSDPSITDINGMNALHHLAGNTVKPSGTGGPNYQKKYDENMDLSVKIAELLMKAGCNPAVKTTKKQTAVTLAIEKVNTKLVRVLVEKGGVISAEKDEDGANALHHLAQQCMGNDLAPLLKILAQENPLNNIKENGLDEKMEVDSNDNGDVVKMDKEPEIPKLKKVMSFRSGLEGIKQMVTEVDHSGYTPFLLACCTYANFTPHDMKDSEVPKVYQNGCDFIRTLIELTGLDVSTTVQKKYQVNDVKNKKSTDEKKEYNEFGKQSAVHFMINRGKKSSDGADYPGLRMVLEKKPDLELKNLDGKTALAVAVERQNKQAVEILLAAGANPNTTIALDKETTVTALTTAATLGNPDLVQLLVRAKAQVDCRNSKTKQTPLHLAVANRSKESNAVDMAMSLLEGGADVNSLDNSKCTPLHLAVSSNSGTSNASTDLEELLISGGANVYAKDNENRTPLHYTFVKQGRPCVSSSLDPVELCSVLTKAMKDQQIDEVDKFCRTPLHLAANRGATICCVHLLQRKAEVNRHDKEGNTPLSLAVNKGHDSCAIMLIQKGANVADKVIIVPPEKKEEEKDKKPSWKWKPERVIEKDETETYTIFQEAIKKELQGVAHMVLDNTTLDSKVIEAALRVNRYHVALRLLKRINTFSSLQITNASRQNLLHVLALDTEPRTQVDLQLKVAKMLVEKGVSVSATDDYGCTPLHYACLKHQAFSLGEFLMEQDKTLDLGKKDKFGRSVLGAFFWNQHVITESAEGSTKWLKMFLSKGGNFNILYDYPTSDVPTFDVIQNVVPDYFTTASERRISPVIFSIHFADFGMVKFLLDHGASPNFPDSEGVTPLMHAVRSNDLSLVKLLLNYSFESDDTTSKKPALVKKASRQVFTIKTFNSLTSVPEENDQEDEDEEDGGDNEDEEECEEEEQDAGDEGDQEDEDDNNDQEDDDDDHDTDIVDWDEDGEDDSPEQLPTLTRMGSKKVSLIRQGSSVNKEEFPTVEKTSPVDLNATDRQGWTVIHHLVCPLDYGTYDAEEILYVLWKAGADVLKKDNAGLSPLQHSLIHCASKLSKRLQMIAAVEERKMEKPTLATQDVRDSLLSGETTVNYQTDAEEMLKTSASQTAQSMEVSKVKGDDSDDDFNNDEEEDLIAKPDPNCQMKDIGELAMDDSQSIPYDVLLSKVDVSCGTWGMFNFYKMQIVWQKGVDIYVLFTRWGRIGDRGQFQHTPFQKKAEAVAEFGKVFRSKTGNYWSNVNSFENQPKKYRLVPREDKRQKERKIEFSLKSDIPSKLPEPVQHLFQEMTSVSMMLAAVNKTGVYSDAMPFGKIKREALIEGRKLLNQLGDLIKAVEDQQKSRMMTAEDTQTYQSNCEKISKVTNEYYHLIPHHGFTFEKIAPINSYRSLKEHTRVLSDLLDLECASKMLLGAQSKLSQMNPLDYIHQAVGCKVEPLTEDSPESQYILKYMYGSCETEVQAIYKLSRPGEEERLTGKNLDNHTLLFHGSSTANFLSILHRGLLVSPPEVPFTGNLFGEGVYFADTFCKSKDYCYNSNPESRTKFCLVCEVALGKVQENPAHLASSTQDLRDTDFNSKCILGGQGPNPAFNIALPYGPTIPLGMQCATHSSKGHHMSFSEYVIQDPSQICLRYLIEFTKAKPRSGT